MASVEAAGSAIMSVALRTNFSGVFERISSPALSILVSSAGHECFTLSILASGEEVTLDRAVAPGPCSTRLSASTDGSSSTFTNAIFTTSL